LLSEPGYWIIQAMSEHRRRACYVVGVQQYRKSLGLPQGAVILYLFVEHPDLPVWDPAQPMPIVCAQYAVVGKEHIFSHWRITGHVGDK